MSASTSNPFNRPFANLPAQVTPVPPVPPSGTTPAKKTRKPRVSSTAEPVYVKKLVEKVGKKTEVSRMVGVSGATIGNAIKSNQVSTVIELAAYGVYQEMFGPKYKAEHPTLVNANGDVFVSMTISPQALEVIKPWLAEAGAKVKTFRD